MEPVRRIWDYLLPLAALVAVVGAVARFYFANKLALAEAFTVGSSLVLALFTVALWRATTEQARATRELQLLQERLQRAEMAPIFFLEGVRLWYCQEPPSGIFLHKLSIGAFYNLGKYGLAVKRIEWWFLRRGVLPELWGEYPAFALAPGERREGIAIDLSPKHVAALVHMAGKREGQGGGESNSVHLGFLVVEFRYGGDPSKEERVCFEMVSLNLEHGWQTEAGGQQREVWIGGDVELLQADCPQFLMGRKKGGE